MALTLHLPTRRQRLPRPPSVPRTNNPLTMLYVVPIVFVAYLLMWVIELVTPRKKRDRAFYPW